MQKNLFRLLFAFLLFGLSQPVAAADLKIGIPFQDDRIIQTWMQSFLESGALRNAEVNITQVEVNSSFEATQMVNEGQLDLTLTAIDALTTFYREGGRAPQVAPILTQPFQFRQTQQLLDVQKTILGGAVLADINRTGLIPIAFVNRGQTNLLTIKEITKADDFAGLQIKTFRDEASDKMLAAIGARPSSIAYTETYQALQAGAVDGVEYSMADSGKFFSNPGMVSGYVPNFRALVYVVVAHPASWSALKVKEKKAIVEAAFTATQQSDEMLPKMEEEMLGVAYKNSIAITDFSDKDFRAFNSISQDNWRSFNDNNDKLLNDLTFIESLLDDRTDPTIIEQAETSALKIEPPILFATDRRDDGGSDITERFGDIEESSTLKCGKLQYAAEPDRNIGDDFDGDISLASNDLRQGEDNCLDFIAKNASQIENGRVLIYIHGFNNSFDDAVRRGITFATDTVFDGTVVVWSWPSDGQTLSYFKDEETIRGQSVRFLRKFVGELAGRTEVEKIDFLVHSMGSRLGLTAIEAISDANERTGKFGIIVFAAPDESVKNFNDTIDASPDFEGLKNLYAAKCDNPLWISERVHKQIRAGTGGSENIIVKQGIQSVDVTDVETTCWIKLVSPFTSFLPLSHSYVFDTPEVIEDLAVVLQNGQSTNGRNLESKTRGNDRYLSIRD